MKDTQPQSPPPPPPPRWKIFSSKQKPILLALPSGSMKEKQPNSSDHRSTSLPSILTTPSTLVNPRRSWRESSYHKSSQMKNDGTDPNARLLHDRTSGLQSDNDERRSARYSPSVYTFGMGSINDGPDDGEPGEKPKDRNEMKELPLFNILPARGSNRSLVNEKAASSVDNSSSTEKTKIQSMKELENVNVPLVHIRRNPSRYGIFLRRSFAEGALPMAGSPKMLPNPKSDDESTSLARRLNLIDSDKTMMRKSIIANSIPEGPTPTIPSHLSLPPPANSLELKRTSYPWAIFHDMPTVSPSNTNLHASLPPLPITDNESTKRKSRFRERADLGQTRKSTGDVMSVESNYGEGEARDGYTNEKGRHVLGLMGNDGAYDQRSRLERNKDAQGIIRGNDGLRLEVPDCVVWLSLLKKPLAKGGMAGANKKLLRIDIPNDLVVYSLGRQGKKGRKYQRCLDFDDEYFALCLQAGYRDLSGNWFMRILGVRKLRSIQVGRTSRWSGSNWQDVDGGTTGLLTIGNGFHNAGEIRSPFTEAALYRLYEKPAAGKARYTWVHWARRLAASNAVEQEGSARQDHAWNDAGPRSTKRIVSSQYHDLTRIVDSYAGPPSPLHSSRRLDTITTIQFVCELSTARVVCALTVMLILSILAAVLWIFLGATEAGGELDSREQASSRVGSGMAIAVLVLLLEGVGFGAWVWLS